MILGILLFAAGFLFGRLFERRAHAAQQRRAMLAHMARHRTPSLN